MAGYVVNASAVAASEGPLAQVDRFSRDIRKNAKLMQETARIKSWIEKGGPLEEYLIKKLPLLSESEIKDAVSSMREGVERQYSSQNQSLSLEEVKKILTAGLEDLNDHDRAQYLLRLLDGWMHANPLLKLADEDLARVEELSDAQEFSQEDVRYLLDLTVKRLEEESSLLVTQAFAAMKLSLQAMSKQGVEIMVDTGKNVALAQAAACFLLQQSDGIPRLAGQDISTLSAYELGVLSAVTVESSKVMALYAAGKVHIDVCKYKLQQLYLKALTYISEHLITILAAGVRLLIVMAIMPTVFSVLEFLLYAYPLLNLLAAVALSCYLVDAAVTQDDAEDFLVFLAEKLDGWWQSVKEFWRLVIHPVTEHELHTEILADEPEESNEEEAEAEEVEEVEEEEES